MTRKAEIEEFLAQRRLAVVGVSRGGKKFGNAIYRELVARGYTVFPVNPLAQTIEGQQCYPDLASLPEPVEGVILVVPPTEAEKVVRQAAEAGVRRVWLQRGAESEKAIQLCHENGLIVVHGYCILMFVEPTAFLHRVHRWIWRALGRLPQ